LSDFAVKNKEKGWYSSECKECHREIRNRIYAANPNIDKERVRDRRVKLRQWICEVRGQYVCACGESHPATLDFHHVDPVKKEFSIGKLADLGWSKKHISAEIKKCVVMCSNCHRKLHWDMRA